MLIMRIISLDNLTDPGVEVEQKLNSMQRWIQGLADWFLSILPHLVEALIVFVAGLWVIRIVLKIMKRAMNKAKVDHTVVSFLHSVVKAALYICLVISILSILGLDVSTLIAALGAAAVTVGLALKDSLSNVASGTLIIINRKFKTGDFIETEGIIGEVIKIEMMYTTLRTYDYKEVMIPNSRLTSNNVINHFTLEARRLEIPVPISYREDYEKAKEVIMKVINDEDRLLKDRTNRVVIDKFGESSVDLLVWVWCESEDYWPVLFDMKTNIKKALDNAEIEIPFNQLDVHFDNEINEKLAVLSGKTDHGRK